MQQTKNVVVVGAGYTGIHLIQKLSAKLDHSKYNLIFITPRPYFLHMVAAIRMVVTSEGKLEDRNVIPLDRTPANGNGKMVVGKVVSISDEGEKGSHVTLDNGEAVEYSILILASGSIWEGPLAVPDGKQELDQWVNEWRSKFEKAEDILLVGGGTVGVGK
jgi:NADH dehydrogenase FAD-containing subunit